LNTFPILIPPLRDRIEDIPLLIFHFLKKYNKGETTIGISDRATGKLINYPWPGNIRELENVIQRLVILTRSEGRDLAELNDLPEEIAQSKMTKKPLVRQSIDEEILATLREKQFNWSAISQVAEEFQIDRGTITERFKGICLKACYDAEWDVMLAVNKIAMTTEQEVIQRVKKKIEEYIKNLTTDIANDDFEASKLKLKSKYQGLPKRYHKYLDLLIKHSIEK